MRRAILAVLVASTLASCGPELEPLAYQLKNLEIMRQEVQTELTTHHAVIDAAQEVSVVVPAADDKYVTKLSALAISMRDHLNILSTHCTSGGVKTPLTVNGYLSLTNQLRLEGASHKEAMNAAGTLAAIKAEEERHEALVISLLAKMKMEADALEADSGKYTCLKHTEHNHEH